MKKKLMITGTILCVFLIVLSACSISNLFSNKQPKEVIPLEYSSTILIQEELPDESFVLAGILETPDRNTVAPILPAESSLFSMVTSGCITTVPKAERGTYLKEYTKEDLQRILGWSEEAFDELDIVDLDSDDYTVWDDVVLFHFPYSLLGYGYDAEKPKYLNKYFYIEYYPETGEVYFHAVEDRVSGAPRTAYRGRIGDRCYFDLGYYDFTLHEHKYYATDAELPVYHNAEFDFYGEVMDQVEEAVNTDERLQGFLPDGYGLSTIVGYFPVGDRIYMLFRHGETYYSHASDGEQLPYEGSELWYVIADADTFEILYVEIFYLDNYTLNIGDLGLYCLQADGTLVAAKLP